MIDINLVSRMAELLRFRRDPPILSALDERPFRFRELHARLETNIGEHVDDNALTRGLGRLTRAGLVHVEEASAGVRHIKTYDLSDLGCEQLRQLEGLLVAYTHLHEPPGACRGGCVLHSYRNTDDAGQPSEHGAEIDVEVLDRMADLVRFRYDPVILSALRSRPRRFRELHARLETQLGEHVDDNSLTRGLGRLTRAGLVQGRSTLQGLRDFKTYSASDRGRDRLQVTAQLLAAYAHVLAPADRCDGTCVLHRTHDAQGVA